MKAVQRLLVFVCMTILLLPVMAQDGPTAPAEAGAVADGAQEGVLLRLKYNEGEVLTYETKMEGVGSIHIAGNPQAIEMKGQMLVTLTVENVDDEGVYTIVTAVDVKQMTVTVAGSPAPPPNQSMTVRTEMTDRGEILDVEVLDDGLPEAQQEELQAQMERLLTGGLDLRRILMGQRIAAFPENPVSPGDEWTGSALEVDLQGQEAPLEIRSRYDSDVEMAGRMTARVDSHFAIDAGAFGEMAAMLEMTGVTTADTRSWFDVEEGRLIASMERTQLTMRINMPAELIGAPAPIGVMLEMFVDSQSMLLPAGE